MTLLRIYFWVASVLLGWALGRMLSSLTPHLLAGTRVRWALETVLAAAFVALTIAWVWLDHWQIRLWTDPGRIAPLLLVVKLFAVHLAAAFVLPPLQPGAATIELSDYYDRARRHTFIPLTVAFLAFWGFRLMAGAEFSPLDRIAALALPGLCLALVFVRRRSVSIALLVAGVALVGAELATAALAGAPPVPRS